MNVYFLFTILTKFYFVVQENFLLISSYSGLFNLMKMKNLERPEVPKNEESFEVEFRFQYLKS